mmetsp:Transcript_10857/g.24573  ORF Transcript_10857/g.24573 Transcript_10857/m.24573 type:complete len:221 (-) Transcript_10857:129-791(-)
MCGLQVLRFGGGRGGGRGRVAAESPSTSLLDSGRLRPRAGGANGGGRGAGPSVSLVGLVTFFGGAEPGGIGVEPAFAASAALLLGAGGLGPGGAGCPNLLRGGAGLALSLLCGTSLRRFAGGDEADAARSPRLWSSSPSWGLPTVPPSSSPWLSSATGSSPSNQGSSLTRAADQLPQRSRTQPRSRSLSASGSTLSRPHRSTDASRKSDAPSTASDSNLS